MVENFYEINIRQYGDERGKLTTIEGLNDIPFEIKRVYYISNVGLDKDRAHHAHKNSKRVLSAIQGSCKATLFDGKIKKEFILDSMTKGVYFNKAVWCELSEFKDNAIVLALADEVYDEADYIRSYEEYIKFLDKQKEI